jgi:hypothetical protein
MPEMTDAVPTTGQTITLTPDWANVRRYVECAARSDLAYALSVAESMGCEAPDLSAYGAPMPHEYECGCTTRNGFPVAQCCTPDTCAAVPHG